MDWTKRSLKWKSKSSFFFSFYKTERINSICRRCCKNLEVQSIQSHDLHLDKEPLLLTTPFTAYISPCPSTKFLFTLAVGKLQNASQLISNVFLEKCSLTLILLHPPLHNSRQNLPHPCKFTMFKIHKAHSLSPSTLECSFFLLTHSLHFSKSNSTLSFLLFLSVFYLFAS